MGAQLHLKTAQSVLLPLLVVNSGYDWLAIGNSSHSDQGSTTMRSAGDSGTGQVTLTEDDRTYLINKWPPQMRRSVGPGSPPVTTSSASAAKASRNEIKVSVSRQGKQYTHTIAFDEKSRCSVADSWTDPITCNVFVIAQITSSASTSDFILVEVHLTDNMFVYL